MGGCFMFQPLIFRGVVINHWTMILQVGEDFPIWFAHNINNINDHF